LRLECLLRVRAVDDKGGCVIEHGERQVMRVKLEESENKVMQGPAMVIVNTEKANGCNLTTNYLMYTNLFFGFDVLNFWVMHILREIV
jgi:hypothetical protein